MNFSTKYYIGFPISYNCNLRCDYCFNQDFFKYIDNGEGKNVWHNKRTFSLQDYRNWRDKHLSDAIDIIMHLYGGEPFCNENVDDVFEIMDFMDKERIDLLSNGIFSKDIIDRLINYKFNRIGFTYHRRILDSKPSLQKRFKDNVMTLKDAGIPIYVKELLIKENRDKIIEHKNFWKDMGVDFKIQDFKGIDRGISQEEYKKYTAIDNLLVSPEFKHGNPCSCMLGYKNLFIRGFDMADVWPKGGDVIACWYDATVVGNIIEDWYNPNYIITKDKSGKRDVKGVDKLYRGDHFKDLPDKR